MSSSAASTKEQDHWRLVTDQVQAIMQQIHEHLPVEMRRSEVIQEEAANRGQIPAPNMQEGIQVWIDTRHI